ncbi:MAG TPA: Fur family transcriptional regulator [Hyphomonadaceae bacterium]|jgi:Fur family iron response transcriptional regulator|nr:Fur family transcriptional regulator [Hyphomonadaceae bacterium]HPN05073.1 Fur family transcriptional regulator [Hyphomonadaceae bacterium]
MNITSRLQSSGLRATPKRLAIGGLLFDGMDRHVTADDVAILARKNGVRVSLATVYNTLNQFVAAGMMKRITVDTDRTYFDTNVSDHHHLFFEENGVLHDIPGDTIKVEGLPPIPTGSKVRSVEVIVRMSADRKKR